MTDPDAGTVALRLGTALLCGAILGLDREIKKRPAGLRTHALVSVGAALVVLVTAGFAAASPDATSRAIQGIITGIGFLGAGVIMQHEAEHRVEGLTTAASIWVSAGLGIACGAGMLALAMGGLAGVLLILVGGAQVERWLARRGLSNDEKH